MTDRPMLNVGSNDWMDACAVCGRAGWSGMSVLIGGRIVSMHRSCGLMAMNGDLGGLEAIVPGMETQPSALVSIVTDMDGIGCGPGHTE